MVFGFGFIGEALGETCIGDIARAGAAQFKSRLDPMLPVFAQENEHIERAARLAHLRACRFLLQELQRDLLNQVINNRFPTSAFTGRDSELINATTYYRKAQAACEHSQEKYLAFEEDSDIAKSWRAQVCGARTIVETALARQLDGEPPDDDGAMHFITAAISEIAQAGWDGDVLCDPMMIVADRFKLSHNGYIVAYDSFLKSEFKKSNSPFREIWTALELAELKSNSPILRRRP